MPITNTGGAGFNRQPRTRNPSLFYRQQATYGGRRNIGVGSRTYRRKEYTTGLMFGRAIANKYNRGSVWSGQREQIRQNIATGGVFPLQTASARAGGLRAFDRMTGGGRMHTSGSFKRRAGPGANLGSFRNRVGQWKKGAGGRFIGSA